MKKYYIEKRKKLLLIICFILLVSSGCSQTEQQEVKSNILNKMNSEEVKIIKEMVMDSGAKLGDLFEAGISSVTYETYDPASDGNTYVTIKGNVIYKEIDVVAGVQYKKVNETDQGSEYEFYTLTFNDIPQSELVAIGFFEYLHEMYEKEGHSNLDNVANTDGFDEEIYDNANYINERFGFSIDYPIEWGIAEESHNGDGSILYMSERVDVRVYASYMMEDSFDSYLDNYYSGWEYNEAHVSGASKSAKLIYYGEDSYQTALVAEKNGTVYTFSVIGMMYLTPEEMDGELEDVVAAAEIAEKKFNIF